MKKIFYFSILFSLTLIPFQAKATDSFTLYFYYNTKTKTLSFDKLAPKNIVRTDTEASIFDFANNKTPGEFILKLYEANGNELVSTEFNKKDGAFSIDIPYFSLATSLKVVEKSTNKEILSADFSELSTCNGNGTCEYEKGETAQNCLGDCAGSKPIFSQETKQKLTDSNNIIKDEQGNILIQIVPGETVEPIVSQPTAAFNRMNYVYIIIGVFILFIAIFFLYKKITKK